MVVKIGRCKIGSTQIFLMVIPRMAVNTMIFVLVVVGWFGWTSIRIASVLKVLDTVGIYKRCE